jgi:hypothetical protein
MKSGVVTTGFQAAEAGASQTAGAKEGAQP